MSERGGQLAQFQFRPAWPVFDLSLLASAMRWGMLVLIIVLLVWLMSLVFPQMEQDGEDAAMGAKQD